MSYLERNQLLKYVNNPTTKGLTKEQQKFSKNVEIGNCDDNFDIFIKIKDDIIVEAAFEGTGCFISLASNEAILSLLLGKSKDEAYVIINMYTIFLRQDKNIDIINELQPFKIIRKHTSRQKCALLPIGAIERFLKENE